MDPENVTFNGKQMSDIKSLSNTSQTLLHINSKERIKNIKKNGSLSTLNSIKLKSGDKLVVGDLNTSRLDFKFDGLKALVLGKVDIFLATNTKLDKAFLSNISSINVFLPTIKL